MTEELRKTHELFDGRLLEIPEEDPQAKPDPKAPAVTETRIRKTLDSRTGIVNT